MNPNGDEKRLRQLFRELSREEEQRTPDFARLIAAAGLRSDLSHHGTRSFGLAWAAALVFIAMLIAVSLAMRHSGTQTQDNRPDRVADDKQSTEAAPAISSPGTRASAAGASSPRTIVARPRRTGDGAIAKRVRYPQRPDELAIRMKAISAWQSPTASLLKTPGNEMTLPRLGESLISIKIFSPDEFN